VLITLVRFGALAAVTLNYAMRLIVVATASPFRASAVSPADLAAERPMIAAQQVRSFAATAPERLGGGWVDRPPTTSPQRKPSLQT